MLARPHLCITRRIVMPSPTACDPVAQVRGDRCASPAAEMRAAIDVERVAGDGFGVGQVDDGVDDVLNARKRRPSG